LCCILAFLVIDVLGSEKNRTNSLHWSGLELKPRCIDPSILPWPENARAIGAFLMPKSQKDPRGGVPDGTNGARSIHGRCSKEIL
jgi:hypothetical protein